VLGLWLPTWLEQAGKGLRTEPADAGLPEPAQPLQRLIAGHVVAFSWLVKVCQVSAGKASWGRSGVAVADGYGWAKRADLDAGSAVAAAVTALAPRDAGHVHRSSALS
jgi:hypothetical protein